MLLTFVIGIIFVILQKPIFNIAILLYHPTAAVIATAYDYYCILIWCVPLILANYVLLGYLSGPTQAKIILYIQLTVNLINLVLVFAFVHSFNLKIGGLHLLLDWR